MNLLKRRRHVPTGCGGGFAKRDLLHDVGRALRKHGREDWTRLLGNLEADMEEQDEVLLTLPPGRARELLPSARQLAEKMIGGRGAGLANQKLVWKLEQRAREDRRYHFRLSQRLRRARWRFLGWWQQGVRRVKSLLKRRQDGI